MGPELPEFVILQRVAVRMLHDEGFRKAVYANSDQVLAGLGLSAAARGMLTQSDIRAWGVDEHRSARVLKAMLDEYPVSALALLEEGRSLQGLHAYFSSGAFHDAVMRREALAPRFGEFLNSLAKGETSKSIITLEVVIARVRRRLVSSSEGGEWVVRGNSEACTVRAPTLVLWQKARAALSEGAPPVARLLSGKRLPKLGKVERARDEHLLVSREPGGEPVVGFVGEGLVKLLRLADRPVPREVLIREAVGEGATEEEANEIIDDIIQEGVLRRAPAEGKRGG
jgi:hypothetical protein